MANRVPDPGCPHPRVCCSTYTWQVAALKFGRWGVPVGSPGSRSAAELSTQYAGSRGSRAPFPRAKALRTPAAPEGPSGGELDLPGARWALWRNRIRAWSLPDPQGPCGSLRNSRWSLEVTVPKQAAAASSSGPSVIPATAGRRLLSGPGTGGGGTPGGVAGPREGSRPRVAQGLPKSAPPKEAQAQLKRRLVPSRRGGPAPPPPPVETFLFLGLLA